MQDGTTLDACLHHSVLGSLVRPCQKAYWHHEHEIKKALSCLFLLCEVCDIYWEVKLGPVLSHLILRVYSDQENIMIYSLSHRWIHEVTCPFFSHQPPLLSHRCFQMHSTSQEWTNWWRYSSIPPTSAVFPPITTSLTQLWRLSNYLSGDRCVCLSIN